LVLLLIVAAVVVAVVWVARTQSQGNGPEKTTLREVEALQDEAARR
jgi:ABC-type transporter Mla subunit MlaD